ncbi:pseudaminic acid synthase [Sediminibacillus dalangtanensis]|uniref:Pseudaminic acid synthase n=1 Tax=Sediminibacillus dalangtanensis TaxID=2729421 RepID=A0ABX7VUL5_9BACI|nr:pseudaminic acid synthase [Sediminibacillus dalangtanensis]QTN00382.1 pseudaminic acid synthase [Sediminibacillus dalangtanensis]
MNEVVIQNRKVGPNCPPFIIAEMSGNHNQSLNNALQIVEEAAKAGADAVKLQTYTPDTMTLDVDRGEFVIKDSNNLWKGKSLYNLYQEAYTPWEWHEAIFNRCRELGLIAFSSPFDETAVDFLEELDVPCYKIASFENTDIPLLRKVASTGKPIIISTGMATLSEIDETVRVVRESGCEDIILLKCTSTYPAPAIDTNIKTIPQMSQIFNSNVGLSDHTQGIGVAIASVALGATVIEKHFTLSREEGGVDSVFSLEPKELQQLVNETNKAWESLGEITFGPTEKEKASRTRRRSLYITKDIKAGDAFTKDNLRAIRPGLGIPPKYYDLVIGKKARKNAVKGTPLQWDNLLD